MSVHDTHLTQTGAEVQALLDKIQNLAPVPTALSDLADDSTHRVVTDTEKDEWDAKYDKPTTGIPVGDLASAVQTSLDKADTAYQKPASGIPASDLADGVIPDVSGFITKSVNDLVNYYTKSETYTKTEVGNLIAAINQFHYEFATSTSAVTSPASNVLYLIGPTGSGADKYEEYVYANSDWTKIGDTSIDLSGYVTTTALNTALAGYTTTTDLNTLLSGKQDTISDLSAIRSGASAGATAYQKPSSGIPASDLASGVIPDAVEANPTVPAGTTPTSLTGLKIGSDYYDIEAGGGGTVTDVTVGGTSVVDGNGVAVVPAIPTVNDATLTIKMNNASKGTFSANAASNTEIDLGTVITSHQDISGKADKVSGATNGHFAGLDSNGNLTDSGKGASDFGTYSKPSGGIPASDLDSAVQTSLGKADTALQSFTETDPTVPSWAKASSKPSYDYSEIGNTPSLATVATSGSYNDLSNTPTIPTVPTDIVKYTAQTLTDEQQAQARTNIGAGTYSKPSGGIPASDITNDSMFVRGNRAIWQGTSITSAATAAKTAAVSNFLSSDLAVGVMVVVTFSNTNIAAPNLLTLNIASRGAKPIKRWVNGGLADIDKPENLTGTMAFVYDGTNWVTWYESFDNDDGNCLDAKFGNVSLHQWKPDYTMTDGSYVKGADGLLYEYSGSKYVEVAVGDAERVRFLGIFPKYSSWTNGFAFGKYESDQWVTIESEKFDYDTSQDASITKEYIRAVPSGATHFRTSCASSSLLALERNFYLYFQTGKPAVSQEELEAAVNAAIIYTDLGEPDWEEYDYDTSAFLTTLRTTGYYSFTMDGDFVYYATVQAVAMGTYTYVLQQYWGSEEGPGSIYYRGFVWDNDNDEVVSDNDMSYMTIQQASTTFAAKSHNHYTNVRDTASIWSYCDTMNTLDATSEVVYTDSTTSTQWLIEGAYSVYQPAVRYQKVTPLQGGTCYYQRCGTVASSTVTWGPWYRFDATMTIATTQPQGGFLPNLVYDLGVLTGTVTFALAAPTDNTRPNPYHWTFDTGSTAPTINWPSGITWPTDFTPEVNTNCHYEVLVRNDYATLLEFSLE